MEAARKVIELLTGKQAASYLGLTYYVFSKLCLTHGYPRCIKNERGWRLYDLDDLDKWLNEIKI